MVRYVMMKSMSWINGELTLNQYNQYNPPPEIDNEFDNTFRQNITTQVELMEGRNTENDSNIFLNDRISYDEVEKVLSKPKNNKTCGIDNILNEVLKNKDINMCLWSLFSKCFEFSCIPSSWSKAIMSLIPKSKECDPYVPPNYRGISLLCCISKLYSSLLNNRLTTYFDTLNLFSDFKNGFRKKRSCEDHAYVLSTVLRNRVLSGKSTCIIHRL